MEPTFLVVDLFCGAGGTTTGFAMTEGVAKVIACVNHDHVAILSHWANHPEVKHFEEDIRTLDLTDLVEVVNHNRTLYPSAKLILWASLECTNFSKAKGGLAREADSRTLADHLHRYVVAISPDLIQIENVTEFRDWGPTHVKMKDGKPVMVKNKHGEWIEGHEPIPELKGTDFKRWCSEICAHGYVQEWKELNSADFGAYTSRNRLFGVFAKDAGDIVWPKATHAKNGKGGLLKHNAVKDKLDFTDEGYSIFYRGSNPDVPKRQRKDLSLNTLERVYAGCIKHIAGGQKAFLTKYHGGKPRIKSVDDPLAVIDTQNRHALVQCFVSTYHGNGDNTHSADNPAPAIVAADVTAAVFINRDFGQATSSSIDDPAGTITRVPKLNLVQADFFYDSGQYTNTPRSIHEPAPVITANRKYPYLVNLQYGGQMQGVDKPCPTLLASGGKTPMYLVVTENGEATIQIYDTDPEIVVKLKEFMALYGIVDIKMRMLRVAELQQIQGFPAKYKLAGSQEDQKKFIGNSVVPDVVKAWALAMHTKLTPTEEAVAA